MLAAQTSDAQIGAQPLGFDVLPGGRFLRTGMLRLHFLVTCPPVDPTRTVPQTSLADFVSRDPFGAVGGRRAIPPQRTFTLVDEPFADGVAVRWQISVHGDRATGSLHAEMINPAYSCASGQIAWSARRR